MLKLLCSFIFWWKPWYILFQHSLTYIASSKEHHLFEIEIFCIIINVFTLTSNQVNVSLLNNSIRFSKNKSIIAMLVYIFHLLYRSPWARQHQWMVSLIICILFTSWFYPHCGRSQTNTKWLSSNFHLHFICSWMRPGDSHIHNGTAMSLKHVYCVSTAFFREHGGPSPHERG